jgi:hypothetical protein
MWIRLASVALCLAGGAAHAQSASESISGLESCIETARFADAICSKLPKDPTQRADCFEKARTAQLECLDRVLAKTSTLSAPPENSSETARPAPPVDTAPAQASPERPASKQTGRTDRPEGGTPAHAAAKPSNASAKSAPTSVPAPATEAPPENSSETARPAPPVDTAPAQASPERPASKQAGRTDRPEGGTPAQAAAKPSNALAKSAPASVPAPATEAPPGDSSETTRPALETARPAPPVDTAPAQASPERPAAKQAGRTDRPEGGTPAHAAAKPSNALAKSAPASVPAPAAEAPTGAIGSNSSGKNNDKPAQVADWIVSETTSPVDYSPLVIAAVRAKSDVKDAPNALAVRCRARHTELSIRTDGAWGAPNGNDLLVDYQINDHPVVRQPWMLSADGKTATYKYDPIELLRSMPEGATLKVAVADKGNVRREATFELAGLSGVREKVGTACKWVPVTANTSSEKR